jgi:hypothetical protein
MATWRDLFHALANKQNIISVGTAATKEAFEDCLKKEMSEDLKAELLKNIGDLQKILQAIREANSFIAEIKDKVYQTINPDTET